MEHKLNRHLCWERLQVVWRGQLRDQLSRVSQVCFLAQESWAQVQIKAPLEVLLDQISIQWHFPQSFKLLWQIIQLLILIIVFKPLIFLLLVKEILLWWIKRLTMQWQIPLRRSDSFGHPARSPCHNRVILPDIPHLFCLLFPVLLFLLLLCECLHPSFLECLHVLGDFKALPFRWNETAFRCRCGVHRMDPVLVLEVKLHVLVVRVDVSISESALSDPTYHCQVALGQAHMLVVELIENLGPPLLVVLAFDKFLQLVLLGQLRDSLTLD